MIFKLLFYKMGDLIMLILGNIIALVASIIMVYSGIFIYNKIL